MNSLNLFKATSRKSLSKLFYLKKSSFSSEFKNKIQINKENILVKKYLSHMEIRLHNLDKTNLLDKSFVFDAFDSLDHILKTIEKEYDILLDLPIHDQEEMKRLLKYKQFYNSKTHLNNEIESLLSKLNISVNDKEYLEFIKILENSKDLNDLKRQYMIICTEIDQMDQTKDLIDKKITFRLNLILLLLLLAFIGITGLFFYCIYYVDELGWDLVEPTTYLFSSVIFLICLFGYIKLQRGFYSATDMYDDLYKLLKRKRYMKYNFNYAKYDLLNREKLKILSVIDKNTRI